MAFQAFDFTFAKTAGPTTGHQVIVPGGAGIPFEPIGLRFMSDGGTGSGTFAAKRWKSYGLAVPPGTGSRTTSFPFTSAIDQIARASYAGTDGSGFLGYGGGYDEGGCILFFDSLGLFGTARLTARGALFSVDNLGGGFWGITINWITNLVDDPARLISCVAYGGVTPGTEFALFNWGQNSVPGTQAKLGVGFRPDYVETIGGDATSGPGPTFGPGYHMHWSAMNCALEQVGVSDAPSNGGGQAVGVREHSIIAAMPVLSDETHVSTVTLVSMDEAAPVDGGGGFTVSIVAPSSTAYGYGLHSFCIKGVASKIGSFIKQATSTSPQGVMTPNVHAVLVSLFGDNNVAVTGLQNYDRMAYGAMTTAGASFCGAASSPRTGDPGPNPASVGYSDRVYAVLNNNTQTIQALLTKVALSNGSFQVGFSSNDAEATEILFAAVGSGTGGLCEAPPPVVVCPPALANVLLGDYLAGNVRQTFAGDLDDDGEDILWTVLTRPAFVGTPQERAYYRRLILKVTDVNADQAILVRTIFGPVVTGTPRIIETELTTPSFVGLGLGDLLYNSEADMHMGLGLIATNVRAILAGFGKIRIRGLEYHLRGKPLTKPSTYA